MFEFNFIPILILALLIFSLLRAAIKIIPEYERAVIFRLGRVQEAKGPGLFFIIPFIDQIQRVDLRVVTLDVPTQEAITLDNVTVRVNAVCYFRVMDPTAAVVQVTNYLLATQQIAQTTLRSVMGQSELDELLSKRDKINRQLQQIIDEQTEPWGVKVSIVEVKDVELPQSMQRAMARQAEAEREKRAKIISAEGEYQASQQLAAAASIMAEAKGTLQLRYLQTLNAIAAENNSTIVFPLPIELFQGIIDTMGSRSSSPAPGSAPLSEALSGMISAAASGEPLAFASGVTADVAVEADDQLEGETDAEPGAEDGEDEA
ncbi:MAG: slipin family protein [Caldilineaceae bacterium]|nr:slipin family protein [Caldilineaceae bacterium]